jgi:hypothetical protein
MLIPLMTLALVAGVLTASLEVAADTSRSASALDRLVRGDALADSGIRRLVVAFADAADDFETAALDHDMALTIGKSTLRLRVEPETGKIDVLKADERMVRRYLSPLAVDANGLLARLGAARGAGDGAAALRALELAGDALPPSRLWRDFSRFGARAIDPQFASAEVLAAVPDLSAAESRALAAMPASERALATGMSGYFASGGRTFSLLVHGGSGTADAVTRRLPVEISASGRLMALAGVQS